MDQQELETINLCILGLPSCGRKVILAQLLNEIKKQLDYYEIYESLCKEHPNLEQDIYFPSNKYNFYIKYFHQFQNVDQFYENLLPYKQIIFILQDSCQYQKEENLQSFLFMLKFFLYLEIKQILFVLNKNDLSQNIAAIEKYIAQVFESHNIMNLRVPEIKIISVCGFDSEYFQNLNPKKETIFESMDKFFVPLKEKLDKPMKFYVLKGFNKNLCQIKILQGILYSDQIIVCSQQQQNIIIKRILYNEKEQKSAQSEQIVNIETDQQLNKGQTYFLLQDQHEIYQNIGIEYYLLRPYEAGDFLKQKLTMFKNNKFFVGSLIQLHNIKQQIQFEIFEVTFNENKERVLVPLQSFQQITKLLHQKIKLENKRYFEVSNPDNYLGKFFCFEKTYFIIFGKIVDLYEPSKFYQEKPQFIIQDQFMDGTLIHKCRLCKANRPNYLLLNCGHLRYCQECFDSNKCKYCDKLNKKLQTLNIFYLDKKEFFEIQNNEDKKIRQRLQIYWEKCKKCKINISTHYNYCPKNHFFGVCEKCYDENEKCLSCSDQLEYKGAIIHEFNE